MNRWSVAVVVLVLAVWGAVAWLHPDFNCNRWDNFEYFTPAIIQAHNQWLSGELPAINPHQMMGEPLIPSGQPGVFYFPYTLSVLIMHALALPADRLMAIIWCLHLPWAALGFFQLMRTLGVRPVFSLLTAMSVCFGGYVISISLIWIFMLAIFSWLPWILWGLLEILSGGRVRTGGALVTLGLAAVASVGYPQMTVYVWLLTLLVLVLFGLWVYRVPKRMLCAVAPLVAGALLSAPTLWPMFLAMRNTSRAEAFSLAGFLERGVPWSVLWQWVCPGLPAKTDFLRDRATVLGYQGAWVVAALVAGLLGKRSPQTRTFVALLGLAVLFTLLALGGNAFLYPLTYGLPVWSSFRWPFKFFLLSQSLVALAAGVGLELGAQTFRVRRWLQWALLMAGSLSAAATLVLCHQPGLKTYREQYGKPLGVDSSYRVLPISTSPADWQMQELGLFHSATINGYFSATGNTSGLIPNWYATCLPCKVDGSLPYGFTQQMLPSHLLRTFNVKYVIAGANDEIARALVEDAGGYRLIRRTAHSHVYENQDALPRAYFASEVRPFTYDAMREGLLENKASLTTAYADHWPRPTPETQGEIKRATFLNSAASFEVNAPAGGFLVFSQRYDPGWRAWVDGQPAEVHAANLTLMGVSVPGNAHQITFRYTTPGLRSAICLAIAGIGVLAGHFLGWQCRIPRLH